MFDETFEVMEYTCGKEVEYGQFLKDKDLV